MGAMTSFTLTNNFAEDDITMNPVSNRNGIARWKSDGTETSETGVGSPTCSLAVRQGKLADYARNTPRVKRRVTIRYSVPVDVAETATENRSDSVDVEFQVSVPVDLSQAHIDDYSNMIESMLLNNAAFAEAYVDGYEPV
jgi:hypothetical protein